jgi:hypothetical protein
MQQTPFQQLLTTYRDNSKTKREKGNYFEKLVINFLAWFKNRRFYWTLYMTNPAQIC